MSKSSAKSLLLLVMMVSVLLIMFFLNSSIVCAANIINNTEDTYGDDFNFDPLTLSSYGDFDNSSSFGGTSTDIVGCWAENAIGYSYAAIKFDLSQIPETSVSSAKLRIHVHSIVGTPAVSLYKSTDRGWSSAASEFPSFSNPGDQISDDYVLASVSDLIDSTNDDNWIEFDVTSFVNAELAIEPKPSQSSFVLTGNTNDGNKYFTFDSKRNGAATYWPQLVYVTDITPPAAVSNITLADSDSTQGIDGRDFTISFSDLDDESDVADYNIYIYKDTQEPADKAAMGALTGGQKIPIKTITKTAGNDGAAASLGIGVTSDSRGQALAGGDYWVVVTAVDAEGNYSFAKNAAKVNIVSDPDTTPPEGVSNITLTDGDSNTGIDGRDFTIGFNDLGDESDVASYNIYIYKDTQEPADKAAMDALAGGQKIPIKTIAKTAGNDGAAANLGIGVTSDSRGQALAGGDYWVVVTAVDAAGNYSFTKIAAKVSVSSEFNITVNDVTANENAGTLTFTITISATQSSNVTVNYATANNTATLTDGDYTNTNGTATITAGQTTAAVNIPINDDTYYEGSENFYLNLSGASGGTITDNQGVGTITDNDSQPTVTLSLSGSPLAENGGTATVTATLSNRSFENVIVNLSYTGTALGSGTDYNAGASITIAAGSLTGTVTITGVNDTAYEQAETVIVDISGVTNGTENGDQQVTASINDDDSAPTVTLGIAGSPLAENGGTATVTATLSNKSYQEVTINLGYTGTAAGGGTDYNASAATITIPAGSLTGSVTITGVNDTAYEGAETIIVDITGVNNGSESGTQQVTASITDDDSAPTATLGLSGSPLNENGGTATVTATLSHASYQNVTVNLTYTGTAALTDYNASAASITITAGNLTGTVTITGVNDATDEDDETVIVDISGVTNGTENGTQQVTATITDDDAAPSLSINDPSVLEGDAGTATLQFTVTLTAASGKTITVDYATTNGTATTADNDYISTTGTLTFTPGQTSKTINVTINGDVTDEGNETVQINLSNPSNAGISDSQGSGTITNDDGPPLITIGDASIAEGNAGTTTLTFTVSLNKVGAGVITVDYSTANATASAGSDYTAASGTVTFNPGQTSKNIDITLIGDSANEENETFYINLGNASGATINDAQAVGTITNDDSQPSVTLSLGGSPISENGGTATITATLSNKSYQDITITLGYTGTATGGGSDYSALASITVTAGNLTGAVTITGVNDTTDEEDETVTVDISGVTNGTENGTQQVTATITDDDAAPSLSINDPSVLEGDAGTATLQFTVTLTAASGKTITVDYATANGTATTADNDYISTTGTLTFTPGQTSKTIDVSVNGDTKEEASETVLINLTNANNATISDNQGIGTITNDEADTTPPGSVTNLTLMDGDSNTGIDGRDFTIGFDDLADESDVASYKIYIYKDTEEPVDKTAMNALAAGQKVAVKTIAKTAGDDGADANLGSSVTADSRGQALTGGSYWVIVTTVDAAGNYGFAKVTAKVTITSEAAPSSSSSSGSTSVASPPAPTTGGVQVIVNGVPQTAATAATVTKEDKTVTTVTVDDNIIKQKLEAEGNNSTVVIPVNNKADVVVGQLNGETVKNMEKKEAVLEIKTENVSYTLPASEINIDDVSAQIGKQVELKDIKVSVQISKPSEQTAKVVEDTANKNSYQVVVKPIEFEITCQSGNKTVNVSSFNGYVERTVAIPDGIDPSKITTGIVLNADGTFSHVPTAIVVMNGKYFAKINSLTNSTYSVIWNPKEFPDMDKHWAKKDVNDLASRLVISGIDKDTFKPDQYITRAEYAAIIVRALGLMHGSTGKASFNDVSEKDWYFKAVGIASDYKLISGYEGNVFMPNKKITREEAMAILVRAMKIAKMKSSATDSEIKNKLGEYKDSSQVATWAKEAVTVCIRDGIATGYDSKLEVKSNITRAETAALIRRMLQKAKLIQ